MNSYFNLDIEESFPGEWQEYLNDVDPKYHVSLTCAMSSLHNWYGDKAHRNTDEWFTILYGLILQQESVLQCTREHIEQAVDFTNFITKENND